MMLLQIIYELTGCTNILYFGTRGSIILGSSSLVLIREQVLENI